MSVTVRLAPLPTIRDLLKLYRVRAVKQLSQNFLLDLRLSDRIVRAAGDISNGEICEIGPGPGSITRSILKHNPKRLIVIEKDERFKPILNNLVEFSNNIIEVKYADIMGYDLSHFFDPGWANDWDDEPPNIHLIGNLPFGVSTPLIIKWMKDISLRRSAWQHGRVKMTLTFQHEVAERLMAPPSTKQRCRMSVMCQNWCKIDYKFAISGSAFLPKPKVDVAVVHLEPLKESVVPYSFDFLERILRVVFNSKRKYLSNSARKLFPVELSKTLTSELIERAEMHPFTRTVQITNEEWKRICDSYKAICDRDPRLYRYNFRGKKGIREEQWKFESEDEDENEEKEEHDDDGDDIYSRTA